MRKYEPQPAEYLLHAKLVAESVPSTKQARRGGQARNGVPAQRPCTPAYTCSQDQTREVAVGSRRARDSHRAGPGPHTTLTDSADGGGVWFNPRTGCTGELTGNGLQVAGHSRMLLPQLTRHLRTSWSTPRKHLLTRCCPQSDCESHSLKRQCT